MRVVARAISESRRRPVRFLYRSDGGGRHHPHSPIGGACGDLSFDNLVLADMGLAVIIQRSSGGLNHRPRNDVEEIRDGPPARSS